MMSDTAGKLNYVFIQSFRLITRSDVFNGNIKYTKRSKIAKTSEPITLPFVSILLGIHSTEIGTKIKLLKVNAILLSIYSTEIEKIMNKILKENAVL
jgi:hypothetical protein